MAVNPDFCSLAVYALEVAGIFNMIGLRAVNRKPGSVLTATATIAASTPVTNVNGEVSEIVPHGSDVWIGTRGFRPIYPTPVSSLNPSFPDRSDPHLYRWDGTNFTLVTNVKGSVTQIVPQGSNVWIGTVAGLYRWDGTKAIPIINVKSEVTGIVPQNSNVWIRTNKELIRGNLGVTAELNVVTTENWMQSLVAFLLPKSNGDQELWFSGKSTLTAHYTLEKSPYASPEIPRFSVIVKTDSASLNKAKQNNAYAPIENPVFIDAGRQTLYIALKDQWKNEITIVKKGWAIPGGAALAGFTVIVVSLAWGLGCLMVIFLAPYPG